MPNEADSSCPHEILLQQTTTIVAAHLSNSAVSLPWAEGKSVVGTEVSPFVFPKMGHAEGHTLVVGPSRKGMSQPLLDAWRALKADQRSK